MFDHESQSYSQVLYVVHKYKYNTVQIHFKMFSIVDNGVIILDFKIYKITTNRKRLNVCS